MIRSLLAALIFSVLCCSSFLSIDDRSHAAGAYPFDRVQDATDAASHDLALLRCASDAERGCGGCIDALFCLSFIPIIDAAAQPLNVAWRPRHALPMDKAGRQYAPEPGPPRA